MKNYLLILFFPIIVFSCAKDPENSIQKDIKNVGKVIFLKDSMFDVKIEKSYLRPDNGVVTDNFAYSDILNIKDSTLMLVTMVSPKNIEDFAAGSVVKYSSANFGKSWKKEGDISADFPGAINLSMPSLISVDSNHLLLVYLVKYSTQRIDLVMEESFDTGRTWSAPKVIYGENQGYQIINNARLVKVGKTVYLPVCVANGGKLASFHYFTNDNGKTWQKSNLIRLDDKDLIEPGITAVGPNELLMNIRTNLGAILFARSYDLGKNWQFEESNFISPSSPQTIRQIPGTNKLVMVWNNNNVNYATHGLNRSPFSLAISSDKGRNWKRICEIESFNNFAKDHTYAAISFDKQFAYISYNERNNVSYNFSIKIAKINLNYLK
ncbi:sialidase family protein [Sphingobacterium puteale]|uniref:sialidase family protein n=1 Tax=Sphingobacterium puteale TaxID=2420510 RepID=UPI003D996166